MESGRENKLECTPSNFRSAADVVQSVGAGQRATGTGTSNGNRVTRHLSRKSGRVSFVRGALPIYKPVPNINIISTNDHLGPYTIPIYIYQLYRIVQELIIYSYTTYIKSLKHSNTCIQLKLKPQPDFLQNRSLRRVVFSSALCT